MHSIESEAEMSKRSPSHLSDEQLLGVLTGTPVAGRPESLAALCGLAPSCQLSNEAVPAYLGDEAAYRLHCARELFTRALAEQLRSGIVPFHNPQAVQSYLQMKLASEPSEVFWVLYLDSQNRLIEAREMFRGTLTQTSVYPREIVRLSLLLNAAAVVLAHNHPSGCTQPSRADEVVTRSLKTALAVIDVRVLDHFIVGEGTATSMAALGLV